MAYRILLSGSALSSCSGARGSAAAMHVRSYADATPVGSEKASSSSEPMGPPKVAGRSKPKSSAKKPKSAADGFSTFSASVIDVQNAKFQADQSALQTPSVAQKIDDPVSSERLKYLEDIMHSYLGSGGFRESMSLNQQMDAATRDLTPDPDLRESPEEIMRKSRDAARQNRASSTVMNTALDDFYTLQSSVMAEERMRAIKAPLQDVEHPPPAFFQDPFRMTPSPYEKCGFCSGKYKDMMIDPLNAPLLVNFLNVFGHIVNRRITKLCKKHQARVSKTIKRARCLGVFKYTKSEFTINTPYDLPPNWQTHIEEQREAEWWKHEEAEEKEIEPFVQYAMERADALEDDANKPEQANKEDEEERRSIDELVAKSQRELDYKAEDERDPELQKVFDETAELFAAMPVEVQMKKRPASLAEVETAKSIVSRKKMEFFAQRAAYKKRKAEERARKEPQKEHPLRKPLKPGIVLQARVDPQVLVDPMSAVPQSVSIKDKRARQAHEAAARAGDQAVFHHPDSVQRLAPNFDPDRALEEAEERATYEYLVEKWSSPSSESGFQKRAHEPTRMQMWQEVLHLQRSSKNHEEFVKKLAGNPRLRDFVGTDKAMLEHEEERFKAEAQYRKLTEAGQDPSNDPVIRSFVQKEVTFQRRRNAAAQRANDGTVTETPSALHGDRKPVPTKLTVPGDGVFLRTLDTGFEDIEQQIAAEAENAKDDYTDVAAREAAKRAAEDKLPADAVLEMMGRDSTKASPFERHLAHLFAESLGSPQSLVQQKFDKGLSAKGSARTVEQRKQFDTVSPHQKHILNEMRFSNQITFGQKDTSQVRTEFMEEKKPDPAEEERDRIKAEHYLKLMELDRLSGSASNPAENPVFDPEDDSDWTSSLPPDWNKPKGGPPKSGGASESSSASRGRSKFGVKRMVPRVDPAVEAFARRTGAGRNKKKGDLDLDFDESALARKVEEYRQQEVAHELRKTAKKLNRDIPDS